jgi:geranylgeranyl pyrophosphate synthase
MADDLEDKSLMRRGKPCTYIKYGVDYAVNTGTFMYFAPTVRLGHFIEDEKKHLPIMRVFNEELVNIHLG